MSSIVMTGLVAVPVVLALLWFGFLAVGPLVVARQRRRARWRPGARHTVTVARGPETRPGYSVVLPSLSAYAPQVSAAGIRSDFCVFVGPASVLKGLCVGRVAHRRVDGTPDLAALADVTLGHYRGYGWPVPAFLTPDRVAGQPALSYRFLMPTGSELMEWHFVRDGWHFIVGYQHGRGDPDGEALVRERLATWTWTESGPAPAGGGVVPAAH